MFISMQRNFLGVQENAVVQAAHAFASVWHLTCKRSLEGKFEGDKA